MKMKEWFIQIWNMFSMLCFYSLCVHSRRLVVRESYADVCVHATYNFSQQKWRIIRPVLTQSLVCCCVSFRSLAISLVLAFGISSVQYTAQYSALCASVRLVHTENWTYFLLFCVTIDVFSFLVHIFLLVCRCRQTH